MDSELRQQMIHSKIEPNIKKEKWEEQPSIFTLGEVAEENGVWLNPEEQKSLYLVHKSDI